MDFDYNEIIYPLIAGGIGFFLREIYSYIKKLFRKETPKINIDYSYKFFSAFGENPRTYKFRSTLVVHNIDSIPVYDVEIYKNVTNDIKDAILTQVLLAPNERIEKKEEIIIKIGDGFNHIEEVEKSLPDTFTNPIIKVNFNNRAGRKFKQKWVKD